MINPSYKTQKYIDNLNEYILENDAGLGKYSSKKLITLDDVFNDYDSVNEIIKNIPEHKIDPIFSIK